MIRILLSTAAVAALAACAASTAGGPAVDGAAATSIPSQSRFELAMGTVDTLVAGGNEQAAIDRLTQLLGDVDLSDAQKAEALYRRGRIRYSGRGYDLEGALSDFDELMAEFGATPPAAEAADLSGPARDEAAALRARIDDPAATRQERFDALFRLGQHEEALDLMLATGLEPDNDRLIAMYQIGYLCDDEELTGPTYFATEPDGTQRSLQFCDFGK